MGKSKETGLAMAPFFLCAAVFCRQVQMKLRGGASSIQVFALSGVVSKSKLINKGKRDAMLGLGDKSGKKFRSMLLELELAELSIL